jgi:hypothetical protein
MALDGHADRPVFVTRNGSHIVGKDWKKMKRLATDELPPSPHAPAASDAEQHSELRGYLRGKGFDEESAEEACAVWRSDMARRRELAGEPVEDALPVSGPRHRLLARETREPNEKVFEQQSRAADAVENFLCRFPDARRVGPGTPAERPLTAKDRQLAADRAAGEASVLRRFPELARIRTDGSGRA